MSSALKTINNYAWRKKKLSIFTKFILFHLTVSAALCIPFLLSILILLYFTVFGFIDSTGMMYLGIPYREGLSQSFLWQNNIIAEQKLSKDYKNAIMADCKNIFLMLELKMLKDSFLQPTIHLRWQTIIHNVVQWILMDILTYVAVTFRLLFSSLSSIHQYPIWLFNLTFHLSPFNIWSCFLHAVMLSKWPL